MQGKERNSEKIDQHFTDFAWAEMSKRLDQEMPVLASRPVAKGQRYGLLLLFLLIGFASGIGTMVYFQKDQPVEMEKPVEFKYNPAEVADVNIAGIDALRSTAENNQLATISQQNKNIENKIKAGFSKGSADLSNQNKKSIGGEKLYTNSSSVIVSDQAAETQAEKSEVVQTNFNLLNDISNVTLKSGHSDLEALAFSKAVQKNEAPLLALTTLNDQIKALTFLNNKEIPLLNIPKKEPQMDLLFFKNPPKLSYGFYLGTQTRNFSGVHGLSTGVFANYQLDNRFSVRSGLGYSVLTGYEVQSSQGIADPLTAEFFEPIEVVNLQEYSTVSSIGNNVDLPVQSLHYIDMPVALDYRMNSKFGILMGMKFSYLVDAKTNGYFSDNLPSEEAARLDKALYNSMKKIDVRTVLGLGVYPTSKIGVELKYNHGLVDYTIDEKWHVRQLNTNKTFELSFNYFLR